MSKIKEVFNQNKKKNAYSHDYYSAMSLLLECISSYERVGYYKNRHNLLLSNGDNISFRMSKNHIGHLLGVNIDYLENSNRFDSNLYGSYEKLKYFAENPESFKMLISNKDDIENCPMFSEYIEEKLTVFLSNINFRSSDIEYIIKYDPEKVYMSEEHGDICDYYIVRKFEDSNMYGVLGLVKDRNSRYDNDYVPATSQRYLYEQELDEFFMRIAKKQEIVYPVIHNINNNEDNYKNSFITFDDAKKKYIKKLKEKSRLFDCIPSVINDFDHTLNRADNKRHENNDILSVIKLLNDSIKSGNELDEDNIYYEIGNKEFPLEVNELIRLTNTMISTVDVNGPEENNYFEVVDENKKLKERLEQATDKEKELDEMIEELTEDNNIKEEKLNEIKETCQKVLKKI